MPPGDQSLPIAPKIKEIAPLVAFLMIISALLYMVLTGIGPGWLRLFAALVMVAVVLVLAVMGWRQLADDSA